MKVHILRFFLLSVVALALLAGNGLTQSPVSSIQVQYQWISAIRLDDGTYQVTLDFTFTNVGETDLSDLMVWFRPNHSAAVPHLPQGLWVGTLPIGGSVSGITTMEVLQLFPPENSLLFLAGVAEDVSNNPLAVEIEIGAES